MASPTDNPTLKMVNSAIDKAKDKIDTEMLKSLAGVVRTSIDALPEQMRQEAMDTLIHVGGSGPFLAAMTAALLREAHESGDARVEWTAAAMSMRATEASLRDAHLLQNPLEFA